MNNDIPANNAGQAGSHAQIELILKRYPIESGYCRQCAREVYDLFTALGFTAKIGHIETDMPFLALADGKTALSNVYPPYHEFVQVGNTVYDAITGYKGLHIDEYKTLFYEGVFDDGTLRLTYSSQ